MDLQEMDEYLETSRAKLRKFEQDHPEIDDKLIEFACQDLYCIQIAISRARK